MTDRKWPLLKSLFPLHRSVRPWERLDARLWVWACPQLPDLRPKVGSSRLPWTKAPNRVPYLSSCTVRVMIWGTSQSPQISSGSLDYFFRHKPLTPVQVVSIADVPGIISMVHCWSLQITQELDTLYKNLDPCPPTDLSTTLQLS